MSKHLAKRQLRGLEKMGDVLIPGDQELASFSSSGCTSEVDRILDYMPGSDLADLKLLLTLLSFLPAFCIGWILGFLERSPQMKGGLGGLLRFIRIGIRGLIMTLYYSSPQALKVLGYQVSVYTGDIAADPSKETMPGTSVGLGSSNHGPV